MQEGVTVAEAHRRIAAQVPTLPAETVPIGDALGRVLAVPVDSERVIPPADCSAMDGYAVKASDLEGASAEQPATLRVVYEVAAGSQGPVPLKAGEAARIFTGAPVPSGANAVVRQEDAEAHGDAVRVFVAPRLREHVRDAGEDLQPGDRVLQIGDRIRPPQIGLLASLGRSYVRVHRRPRVAILSGGDELVEPDRSVAGGRIVSSNSYTLAAACREIGADPVYLGIASDEPADVEAHFRAALHADCIVSSAGVSVGDHDHVRGVLEKLGCRLDFWGIQMKPGYPVAFGRFEGEGLLGGAPGPLVFGLPGNPVSATVTFEQFVRPTLLRMMGDRHPHRPVVEVCMDESLRKKAGRVHFVRVMLERREGELHARSAGNQSSGVMRSLSLAQGLLIFPREATELRAGERAQVQILDDRFFQGTEPGFLEST